MPPNLNASTSASTTFSASTMVFQPLRGREVYKVNEASPLTSYHDPERMCKYPSKVCYGQRATKRNGERHNFCELHRAKANRNQQRLEKKRKAEKRSKAKSTYCHSSSPPSYSSTASASFSSLRKSTKKLPSMTILCPQTSSKTKKPIKVMRLPSLTLSPRAMEEHLEHTWSSPSKSSSKVVYETLHCAQEDLFHLDDVLGSLHYDQLHYEDYFLPSYQHSQQREHCSSSSSSIASNHQEYVDEWRKNYIFLGGIPSLGM